MARKKSLLSPEAKRAIINARNARSAAKKARKAAQQIYKDKIREMRPYLKSLKKIDMRKRISKSKRTMINKAWDDYQALTVRPTKVIRSRKNNAKLQELYHGTRTTKFDVTFLPTADPQAKVRVNKKGEVIVKSKYVDEKTILFNMTALMKNPDKEIQRVLAANPEYKMFMMMADEYVFNGLIVRNLVSQEVQKMMARYSPGGDGYERGKNRGPNHHYKNWLHGLKAFNAKEQKDISKYRTEYNHQVLELKRKKKNARQANLRKYGKKF